MFANYQCNLLVTILVLAIACQYASAYFGMQTLEEFQRNPNIRCPGKNEDVKAWPRCKHGGYIENPDPKNCGDRYVCYVGIDENCEPGDKCADDGICTMCGICQKCESPEKCSPFRLCPNIRGNALFKRMMQKPLSFYNKV